MFINSCIHIVHEFCLHLVIAFQLIYICKSMLVSLLLNFPLKSFLWNKHGTVLQEGTNPVVIRSKGERKKLLSRERWKLGSDDIIELIPGHYLFKYVSAACKDETSPGNKQKRPFSEESITDKGQMHGKKKAREVCEEASELVWVSLFHHFCL